MTKTGFVGESPLFVVAAPCAGTSLVFDLLAQAEPLSRLSGASRAEMRRLLAERDPLPRLETVAELRRVVRAGLRPARGRWLSGALDNAWNIPLLDAAFPDARFVYLYREPREQLERMLAAHVGGATPESVVAQWLATTESLLRDLSALSAERWCALNLGDLLAQPEAEAHWLARFAELTLPPRVEPRRLSLQKNHLPPRDALALPPLLPLTGALAIRAQSVVATRHPSLFALSERERWAVERISARPKSSAGPRALAAGVIAAAASVPATALGAMFTVINTNDTGAGSLRQAVADANADTTEDSIIFADGLTGTIMLSSGPLQISQSVNIAGPGANSLTVAGSANRVFYLYGDSAVLDVSIAGLTISGGSATNGGCIASRGENLELDDVVLQICHATEDGGAIFVDGQSLADLALTIRNSTIGGNTAAANGGGIGALDFAGTMLLDNVVIQGNAADDEGGGMSILLADGGSLTVQDSAISDNEALSFTSGGIFVDSYSGGAGQGEVLILATTISDNEAAASGGGLVLLGVEDGQIVNSTVSGNTSGAAGGAIAAYETGTTLLIENSTISGNTNAPLGYAGAIHIRDDAVGTLRHTTVTGNTSALGVTLSTVTVENSILANSTGGNDVAISGSTTATLSHTLLETPGSAVYTDGGGNITEIDPALGPLADNYGPTWTHLPDANSQVIDVGDPEFTAPPILDQRGLPRVFAAELDMGAVERIDLDSGEETPLPCTPELGAVICVSGFCAENSDVCVPEGGCAGDVDCLANEICNVAAFECEPDPNAAGGTGGTAGTGGSGGTAGTGGTADTAGSGGIGGSAGTGGSTTAAGGSDTAGSTGTGGGFTISPGDDSEGDSGCGCEVPGTHANSNGALAGLLLIATALGRRRRQR